MASQISDSSTPYAPSPPSGSRTQELSRQKILTAALGLFREVGFERATMRAIAAAAGLSTGALFANFNDKVDIFLHVLEAETLRLIGIAGAARQAELPLAECLSGQFTEAFKACETNVTLFLSANMLNYARGSRLQQEILRLSYLLRQEIYITLELARQKGELTDAVDLKSAADALEDLAAAHMRRAYLKGIPVRQQTPHLLAQVRIIVAGLKAEVRAAT